jgi:oligoribonuclease
MILVYPSTSTYTKTMTKPSATFLALDLETTGLDPELDQILECAAVVCGEDLRPYARDDLEFSYERVLTLNDRARRRLVANEFVTNMHTANGLLVACEAAEGRSGYITAGTPHELAFDLIKIIDSFDWTEGKPILLGSTIRFDYSFLRVHCPEVAARFHHRQLDVTAAILLAKTVGGEFPKAEAHRAMPDVLESLEDARRCRDLFRRGVAEAANEARWSEPGKGWGDVVDALDPAVDVAGPFVPHPNCPTAIGRT